MLSQLACPRCHAAGLMRVHRHLPDRLLSLFQPNLRLRCSAASCGWEGLVRRGMLAGGGAQRGSARCRMPVLEVARGPAGSG
jgi:hypothetical protein